jgi:SAM-dependent methyltransferase
MGAAFMNQLVFDGESLITPEAIASEAVSADTRPQAELFSTAKAQLALILSLAKQQFEEGKKPAGIVNRTATELHKLRAKVHPDIWRELLPIARAHPVSEFFLQDPFTRWSSHKPRGYSGDAQLLDFIYGHPSVVEEIESASKLGRAVYDYTKDVSSSVAVRERRDILTKQVDEIAVARGQEAEILTIAAGHLREADRSNALQQGKIKRWVALDQDPLSVGSIIRDFRGTAVEAIDGSVRGLLTDSYKLGQFDFVYAAGLYDYLSHKVAVKLTQCCLQMLKPNGVFLFANFAKDISVDGYMETFMNWELLLRSESDMWKIVNASVDRNAVEASVYFGENRNILYGVLKKRT